MKIEFTGRKTEVPEPLRRLGERKLAKLARVLPGITRAHVTLSTDRHRQVVEVNVRSPRIDLAAQEASADFGVSMAAAFEKVTRQALHRVGKRLDQKRRARSEAPAPRSRGSAAAAESRGQRRAPAAAPSRALRPNRVKVPSLTPDEAVLAIGRSGGDLLLYKDATTSRLQILHRGRDGALGLFEPEV
jgi:putative sigma-54 modulation protein